MSLEVGDLVQLNQQRALSNYYVPEIPIQGMGVVLDIGNFGISVYWIAKKRISTVPRILLIKLLDKKS